jgi:hypothetical protein
MRQKTKRGHRCVHIEASGKAGGSQYGEECVRRNPHGIEYLKLAKDRTPPQTNGIALFAAFNSKM